MKLFLSCHECILKSSTDVLEFYDVQVDDLNEYNFICKNNHNSRQFIKNHKYEMLFEIGVNSIVDGYYREAISCFSASLERFYELAVKVMLMATKNDLKAIDEYWKAIGNQSERQLGAFCALWMNHYREVPELLSTNLISLRNDVIHKGIIPSRKQVIDFGSKIFRLITIKLEKLIKLNHKELLEINPKIFITEVDGVSYISSSFVNTIICSSIIDKNYEASIFEDEIKKVQRLRGSCINQLAKFG